MKVLWVSTNFLHPTTKGGHIRTLEMLRQLHRRHEIHYVAIEDPLHPEGPGRAKEYCTQAYPFQHRFPGKRSLAFGLRLARSLFEPMPAGMSRFCVPALGRFLRELAENQRFDRAVCDFLHPASHFPAIERAVLFQHNVETTIWRRLAANASNPLSRRYLRLQADRMLRYERQVCRAAGRVIAVSEEDASVMRRLFGVERVSAVPTGVDIAYFKPPSPAPAPKADLVFVGSMDWLPNIDGLHWFVRDVLPLIREKRPGCSLTIAGRLPVRAITAMAEQDALISVTGTVPDIRPYLWGARVSVVPLRIGGGTRLKIYEAMAAGAPVVSTTVGAEGLTAHPPRDIRIADSPQEFAGACVELLDDRSLAARQVNAAAEMVAANFSWEQVAVRFEQILEAAPRFGGVEAASASGAEGR